VKTICISQPRFFPSLHYLDRMLLCDVFVILDTVQFNPRHFENRTRLKSPQGVWWFTVPTIKASHKQLILDTRIDNRRQWQSDALKSIRHFYAGARMYQEHVEQIESLLSQEYSWLVDLDIASWGPALRSLTVECAFINASQLSATGSGNQLLVDICKELQGDTYLSGPFGRDYLHPELFRQAGIALKFHDYQCPEYVQRFGEFDGTVSYLDVLFNSEIDRKFVGSGRCMSERE
jgi:hypothetical protein